MRVRPILLVLATLGIAAGCSERADLLAPSDVPALDGGILTIGSGGKEETPPPSSPGSTGTNPDSTTTPSGILTIGSDG
jgi:hypothetical protein